MGWLDDLGRGAMASVSPMTELFRDDPFGMQGGFFKKGSYSTPDPKAFMTPEQQEALGGMMAFARSGKFGPGMGMTAGETYKGSLGDFEMTGTEKTSQSKLDALLKSGMAGSFGLGTDEIKKLLTTNAYDPNNDGGVYSGLTAGIDYNTQRAMDAAKHAGAYSGGLYSSGVGRNIQDVAIQGGNQKSSILAGLYKDFADKKFNAIPLALGAGESEEGMNLNRINAGYSFGGLPRALNTARDQANYGEFQRSRSEAMSPLNMMAKVYGNGPNWGTPGQTIETPSQWNRLLDMAVQGGATALGAYAGGPAGASAGAQIGGSFKPSQFGGGGAPMYNPDDPNSLRARSMFSSRRY